MIILEYPNPSQYLMKAVQAAIQENAGVRSYNLVITKGEITRLRVEFRDYYTFRSIVSVLDEERFYVGDN